MTPRLSEEDKRSIIRQAKELADASADAQQEMLDHAEHDPEDEIFGDLPEHDGEADQDDEAPTSVGAEEPIPFARESWRMEVD